jgi:hypothetical protein
MYHQEIEHLARTRGYALAWVKIISDGLDVTQRDQLRGIAHDGYAVVGLSAGGLTAYALMAYRSDIHAGVFAGALQPLDFLRQEYRVKDHPNCWDIPGILSYTTIQALIAPRPIQFQMGKKDPFWPSGNPLSKSPGFDGTSRGVMSDEFGGHLLILDRIWRMLGGEVLRYLHEGGHEVDVVAAIRFLADVWSNRADRLLPRRRPLPRLARRGM